MSIEGDDGLSGIPWPYGYGVKGESAGRNGVVGLSGGNGRGVYGEGGTGVHGRGKYAGVIGSGGLSAGHGVVGVSNSDWAAVSAENNGVGSGVYAVSRGGPAVVARGGLSQAGPNSRAVYAEAYWNAPAAIEARHYGTEGFGIVGASNWLAGFFENSYPPGSGTRSATLGGPTKAAAFQGDVIVWGTLQVTRTKSFLIDHPADPANRYLEHASVESDERKNIYDGIAVLGETGEAEVELPGWFAALNRDFRYQLTCLGKPAQVYIAREIEDNRFRIAGGEPGLRVSWQVTGIRQDAWSQGHPFAVERDKSEDERGLYLEPALYGEPPEKALGRLPRPEPVRAELLERRPELDELLERRGRESGPSEPEP